MNFPSLGLLKILKYKKIQIFNPHIEIKVYVPRKVSSDSEFFLIYVKIKNRSLSLIKNQMIRIIIPDFLMENNYNPELSEILITENLGVNEEVTRCLVFSFVHFRYLGRTANFLLILPSHIDPSNDFLTDRLSFGLNINWKVSYSAENLLADFILNECYPVSNPFDRTKIEPIDISEFSAYVEKLMRILTKKSGEKSFKDLYNQIKESFMSYLHNKGDPKSLIILSARFETMVKQVLFFSNENWKLSFHDVIRLAYNIQPNSLKEVDPIYWGEKDPLESNLRVVYKERNRNAHEAYELSPTIIERGIKSIFVSWILCIRIWQNRIDLE